MVSRRSVVKRRRSSVPARQKPPSPSPAAEAEDGVPGAEGEGGDTPDVGSRSAGVRSWWQDIPIASMDLDEATEPEEPDEPVAPSLATFLQYQMYLL